MIALLILVLLLGLLAAVYLLGFHLGGQNASQELLQVRLESLAAQRAMHDLTRTAFAKMLERVERRP